MASEKELSDLTKSELIKLAETAGLDLTGTKADLAARLANTEESDTGSLKEPVKVLTKDEPDFVTTVYTSGTDAAFIVGCFEGQLGRSPTKSELKEWIGKLYNGNTRNYIQNAISDCDNSGRSGWNRLNPLEAVGKDISPR